MKKPLRIISLLLVLLLSAPVQAQDREIVPDAVDRWLAGHAKSYERPAAKMPMPIWERGGIMSGHFSYYGKGPTDGQRKYAISRSWLPADWLGPTIAVIDCGRVGSTIWIDIGRGWEAARAVDCMGKDGYANGAYQKWVASDWLFELDYYNAVEIGAYGNGLMPGRMSFDPT